MISLSTEQILALPVDQLGIVVLNDLVATSEWNEYNYLLGAQNHYSGDALLAVTEAMAWLRARALIARTPGNTSDSAISITRTGLRVVEEGPTGFFASERLQQGLHPLIEKEARPQFLIGKFELGVFASMKAVEVRVRQLGGFPADVVGVDLMNNAFRNDGPLRDAGASGGEQEGVRSLFAGGYAVLRNPAGHREVNYDNVSEAAEGVLLASLLMRILDRAEQRLAQEAST